MSTRDVNKFLEFIKPCYSDALNYSRGLCRKGNRLDEAEDIFQDSLLKALENFDGLEDESKFRNWIFTIITNTYISHYRKKLFGKIFNYDEYKDFDRLPEIFPRAEQDEILNELYVAISHLKDKEKIAFLLFEIGGFTIEEIRSMLGERSQSAVKSRLSRARDKLRKTIEGLERNRFKGNTNNFGSMENLELETVKLINKLKP